jgi:hypothetical protein
MEATGVYWKPVWHILDGRFGLILANAAHVKTVPGRKSDVNDACLRSFAIAAVETVATMTNRYADFLIVFLSCESEIAN